MTSSAIRPSILSEPERRAFSEYLQSSKNVMALLGAGLSAASGLPTFRGAGGVWRSYPATSLATPEAFEANPGFVWQFYSYRRHMALKANPNRAHFALAELARKNPHFITLTQNIDGLSSQARHPESQLHLLHGSLFDVKCASPFCTYVTQDYNDPIVPALGIPKAGPEPVPSANDKTGEEAAKSLSAAMQWKSEPHASPAGTTTATQGEDGVELDISNANVPIPHIASADLPQCPLCKENILRPGVVWFGEAIPLKTVDAVQKWIDDADRIDLILVIGTTAQVFPAAGYVEDARDKGARVAVVNMDIADIPPGGMLPGDWFFQGDASVVVPELLRDVIGDV
ncbi:transcriptional regulatory protein [Histoplasma ohiense]|nr:transcriptional regulatory protein [Histoplasma ohiense (nom. inval.)]